MPFVRSIYPSGTEGHLDTQPDQKRAYRALISDIADQAPDDGFPADVDLLQYASPLSDEELALVCSLHAQAVTDELSLDPTLIARFLRREISTDELVTQLKHATERAVCEAIRKDVLSECENRAEMAYEHQMEDFHGGGCMTPTERMLHELGVARHLK